MAHQQEEPMEVDFCSPSSLCLALTSDQDNNCAICLDEKTNTRTLHKCSHSFCSDCIEQQFKYKPQCPVCFTAYGKMIGNQPDGQINLKRDSRYHLSGYEDSGIITVSYNFPNGIQTDVHPNPGQKYYGTSRIGYLPDNKEGIKVAKLLWVAFNRKLVFTVGRSRTTGQDNVVTWNDIHHKTSIDGGPHNFGYPDPTYLSRVLEELAAKGVTDKDLGEAPESVIR